MVPYLNLVYGDSSYLDRFGVQTPSRFLTWFDALSEVESNVGDFRVPNNQRFTKSWQSFAHGSLTAVYSDGTFESRIGVLPGQPDASVDIGAFSPNVFNDCLENLFDQVRGGLDLSVDIAEASQARSMVSKALQGLADLGTTVRKVRRWNSRGPSRRNAREAADAWLQFTYGWKPLANSIYQTGQQIANQMANNRDGRKLRFRARASSHDRSQRNFPSSTGVPALETVETSHRCEIVGYFCLDNSAVEAMAGFTSLNPVSVAWELVPYSFVIDWVVNVGGYLRNLESALLYANTFAGGYVTESRRQTAECLTIGASRTGGVYYAVNSLASAQVTQKRRQRLTSLPFPRLPQFSIELGWQRLVSAASLLTQQLSRSGGRYR